MNYCTFCHTAEDLHEFPWDNIGTCLEYQNTCEMDGCDGTRMDGKRYCPRHTVKVAAFIQRTQERIVDHS